MKVMGNMFFIILSWKENTDSNPEPNATLTVFEDCTV